jgi:hypothetical protein
MLWHFLPKKNKMAAAFEWLVKMPCFLFLKVERLKEAFR